MPNRSFTQKTRLSHPSSTEESLDQLIAAKLEVSGHFANNSRQGADFDRIVIGNRDVMLSPFNDGQAQMAAGLTRDLVTEAAQGFRDIRAREVSW